MALQNPGYSRKTLTTKIIGLLDVKTKRVVCGRGIGSRKAAVVLRIQIDLGEASTAIGLVASRTSRSGVAFAAAVAAAAGGGGGACAVEERERVEAGGDIDEERGDDDEVAVEEEVVVEGEEVTAVSP